MKNFLILILIAAMLMFVYQEDNFRREIENLKTENQSLQRDVTQLVYEKEKVIEELVKLQEENRQHQVEQEAPASNIIAGEISAYTSCEQDVYTPSNIMANGEHVHVGAVANNLLPLGTRVRIGGNEYVVKDRTAMHDFVFDIYMDTLEECNQFGRQYMDVEVLQ